MAVIWHNPRCSKSRQALALLQENGIDTQVRLYLKDPPDAGEIAEALAALGLPANAVLRKGEAAFDEAGLSADSSEGEIVAAMAGHPILIERPIVFNGPRAVVGRPPETVLRLFAD